MNGTKICLSLSRLALPESTGYDLVEIRIDLLAKIDLLEISNFVATCPVPVLLTIRNSHLHLAPALAKLKPAYMDFEWNVSPSWLTEFHKTYPKIQIILSYHGHFSDHQWKAALEKIESDDYICKLALHVDNALEALQFCIETAHLPDNTIRIPMGEAGRTWRPLTGSIIFTSPNQAETTASGQWTLADLIATYNVKQISKKTTLFGLIGSPITGSPGHLVHNAIFKALSFDAAYIKIDLKKEEIAQFLELAKKLPFKGFSVTMPLKEEVAKLVPLEPRAAKAKAVNTLILKDGNWVGENTDGIGIYTSVKAHLPKPGKIVLLGGGGAARAIATEFLAHGHSVTLIGRKMGSRAHLLGKELSIPVLLVGEPFSADILINCTPDGLSYFPKDIPNAVIFDIFHAKPLTPLILKSKSQGLPTILGFEMYIHQATTQLHLWLSEQ